MNDNGWDWIHKAGEIFFKGFKKKAIKIAIIAFVLFALFTTLSNFWITKKEKDARNDGYSDEIGSYHQSLYV